MRSRKSALSLQKLAKDIIKTSCDLLGDSWWCKRVSDLAREELFGGYAIPLAVLVKQDVLEKVIVKRGSRRGNLLPDRYFYRGKGTADGLDYMVHAYIVRNKVLLNEISYNDEVAREFMGYKHAPPATPPFDLAAALKRVREDIERSSDPRRRLLELLDEIMPRWL